MSLSSIMLQAAMSCRPTKIQSVHQLISGHLPKFPVRPALLPSFEVVHDGVTFHALLIDILCPACHFPHTIQPSKLDPQICLLPSQMLQTYHNKWCFPTARYVGRTLRSVACLALVIATRKEVVNFEQTAVLFKNRTVHSNGLPPDRLPPSLARKVCALCPS